MTELAEATLLSYFKNFSKKEGQLTKAIENLRTNAYFSLFFLHENARNLKMTVFLLYFKNYFIDFLALICANNVTKMLMAIKSLCFWQFL